MKCKIIDFISRYVYLFSAFATFILFAVIFKCNNLYPFGELTISWCDMDQQTIPLLCDLKDVLSGNESLFLSLQNAGGMNFYGVYFFNLSSPFTYLILFFDKSQIPQAVNLMVILKFTLASLTFALWLKYTVKECSPFVIIPISLTYAFSGYSMMYYQILSWLDTIYLFPILLIGLQRITEGRSNLVYILTLFACVLCHFYLSWAVIIFVCLYAGTYCLMNKQNAKQFASSFIIGSVISALLSCIVLIPCFLQYTHSMRGGNIISGLKYEQFFPPTHTSLPTFFCLLLTLPFALYFGKNSKVSQNGILFILTLFPVFVEPISMAWQTYDYMSFPTRYGFITIAMGLTLATTKLAKLLNEQADKKPSRAKFAIQLAVTGIAVLLVAVFARYSYQYFITNKKDLISYSSTLWGNEISFNKLGKFYLIFLIFGIVLVALIKFKLIRKIGVYAVIGALCVVEAVFSCGVYMVSPANDFSEFKMAYQINGVIQDEQFYRLKTESKYFDVNLIGGMGYNSMSHYTSLNRESYMLTAKSLGYSSYWMEVNSNGGTIFTDALMRNKYSINSVASAVKGEVVSKTENFKITKNSLILPFGFLIEGSSSANADLTLPRWQIQANLCQRLLGVNLYEEHEYTDLTKVSVVENTGKNYSFKLEDEGGCITYKVKVAGKKTLYFDCFDTYSNSLRERTYDTVERVSVYKNGYYTKGYSSYPTQSRNGCLNLGTFENATVEVKVFLKKDVNYNTFGVFSVDDEALKNAVNQSIGGLFEEKSGKITGEITASNGGQYAFFCLPYDEGYKAKVNGKKAEVVNVNNFIAVKLESGKNQVSINFVPEGLYLAIMACVIGITLLVVYNLFKKRIMAIKHLSTLCYFAVIGLLALVIIAVYLFPPFINITKYF